MRKQRFSPCSVRLMRLSSTWRFNAFRLRITETTVGGLLLQMRFRIKVPRSVQHCDRARRVRAEIVRADKIATEIYVLRALFTRRVPGKIRHSFDRYALIYSFRRGRPVAVVMDMEDLGDLQARRLIYYFTVRARRDFSYSPWRNVR